jgi:hypothetical protein
MKFHQIYHTKIHPTTHCLFMRVNIIAKSVIWTSKDSNGHVNRYYGAKDFLHYQVPAIFLVHEPDWVPERGLKSVIPSAKEPNSKIHTGSWYTKFFYKLTSISSGNAVSTASSNFTYKILCSLINSSHILHNNCRELGVNSSVEPPISISDCLLSCNALFKVLLMLKTLLYEGTNRWNS